MDFADDIRSARLAREWSKDRLADEAGIETEAVDAIEAGQLTADIPAVMSALGLSELHMVIPTMLADFVRAIRPVIASIEPKQLPRALGQIMELAGSFAAGMEPLPRIGQLNVINGIVDLDQRWPPGSRTG